MPPPATPGRDLDAAARRAALETGGAQRVGLDVPLGGAPFADDTAPRDALVAVPLPPGSTADVDRRPRACNGSSPSRCSKRGCGPRRCRAGGRRSTPCAPLLDRMPACPPGGVQLATQWVEPAYLEPDASWCEPGGEPASPLANGGAFGGKVHSAAPSAARELADRLGRTVRVVYAREDVVRLGPKRPPIAAVAVARRRCRRDRRRGRARRGRAARVAGAAAASRCARAGPRSTCPARPSARDLRAVGLAEQAMLVAGALGRDVEVVTPSGARCDRARSRSSTTRSSGVDVDARGRRPTRRRRAALLRDRRRAHGARLDDERGPRRRSRRPARSTTSRSVRSVSCARPRPRRSR